MHILSVITEWNTVAWKDRLPKKPQRKYCLKPGIQKWSKQSQNRHGSEYNNLDNTVIIWLWSPFTPTSKYEREQAHASLVNLWFSRPPRWWGRRMLLLQEHHRLRGSRLAFPLEASPLHSGTAWSWWGYTPSPTPSADAQTPLFLQTDKREKERGLKYQSDAGPTIIFVSSQPKNHPSNSFSFSDMKYLFMLFIVSLLCICC